VVTKDSDLADPVRHDARRRTIEPSASDWIAGSYISLFYTCRVCFRGDEPVSAYAHVDDPRLEGASSHRHSRDAQPASSGDMHSSRGRCVRSAPPETRRGADRAIAQCAGGDARRRQSRTVCRRKRRRRIPHGLQPRGIAAAIGVGPHAQCGADARTSVVAGVSGAPADVGSLPIAEKGRPCRWGEVRRARECPSGLARLRAGDGRVGQTFSRSAPSWLTRPSTIAFATISVSAERCPSAAGHGC
jgi:hypothetical protein